MTKPNLPPELITANLMRLRLRLPTVKRLGVNLETARTAAKVLAEGDEFSFEGESPIDVLESLAALIDAHENFQLLADVCAAGVRAFQETAQRDFVGPEKQKPRS